ncbi:hypothetical protein D9M68_507180 [compost metagenome]
MRRAQVMLDKLRTALAPITPGDSFSLLLVEPGLWARFDGTGAEPAWLGRRKRRLVGLRFAQPNLLVTPWQLECSGHLHDHAPSSPQSLSPSSFARRIAWVRRSTPSLALIRWAWVFTVCSEMNRASAICWLA